MILLVLSMSVEAKNSSGEVKVSGVNFVKSVAGIEEYKLDNGLKIILKPNQNVPLLSWQVWYKVGSRNESLNLTGLAHYLEHIMFKGTKELGKGEIAQLIQLKGGVFNAFTSDDYTAYFENFSPENLELAIKIEADRMQNSRIDKDEVELERSVIVSELEGNRNNPTNIAYEHLKSTAFDVHTYRNPVIGWRQDLDNINSKNMREFYETYYYPDNAVAILVGNFDKEEALKLIKKYFGQYKAKENIRAQVPQEPEQKAIKQVTIHNGGYSKILAMAFHVPEFNHEHSPALTLLSEIVFGGMSSRLYPKLVDSGLALSVSGVPESGLDPSIFRIIVNLNQDADIKKVEDIIKAELEAIKNDLDEEELKIAKAKEEASFIYQLDGVYDEGLQIGYFEAISNDWAKYTTWMDDIRAVSQDDIKAVAKKYFRPANMTSVYLLPDESTDTLAPLVSEASSNPSKEANYGAATVEPLDPKKLKRLLKIAKSDNKAIKHHLDFDSLDILGEGVDVYIKEDHSVPLVYFNTAFYAGSIEDSQQYGLAFLTNKMLDRGSKKKSKYEISKLLDLYGADIEFKAGVETGRIEFSSITKNLDAVVEILQEILQEPAFDQEELDRLKTKTIASLKQEDDQLRKIAERDLSQLIYPKGHPFYRNSVEDRVKSLEAISLDDIKAFYKKYYNPKNLMISIVGDINKEKASEIIAKLFASWNGMAGLDTNKLVGNNRPEISLVDLKEPEKKIITKNDKTQVEIVMGHASEINRMHPDYYPLLIANYALGGSALSSRLGTSVRDEHGYVYNIRSGFSAAIGAGAYQVKLGCNPKNVTKAIELTKTEIQEFLKEGISETELEVTKSYLIGSFAVRNLSSNEAIVNTLSQLQVYELGDDYIETYTKLIEKITLQEVNTAARKYIHPDKFNTVIVGPKFD